MSVKGAQVEKDLLLTVVHWDVARPSRGDRREGLPVDRGARSPACGTDAERMAAGLEAPDRLITETHIRRLKGLLPILEQIARMGHPRVLIAEDGPVRAKLSPAEKIITVQGVACEGNRGRPTISCFLKHCRLLPYHPYVRAPGRAVEFLPPPRPIPGILTVRFPENPHLDGRCAPVAHAPAEWMGGHDL